MSLHAHGLATVVRVNPARKAGETDVVTFRVAIARDIKKEGQPDSDFFNATFWAGRSKVAIDYLKVGQQFVIEDAIFTPREWTTAEGVKRTDLELNIQAFSLLRRPATTEAAPAEDAAAEALESEYD